MDQKQLRADVIKLLSKVNSRTWDCQCGWSRKVFICCKASWRQRSVSSFKWKFVLSIGSNQLSDLSKVCLPSVHVWGKFSYYFGDSNNVIRNLLRVRVTILVAVNVWDIGYVWTTYYIQTIEVQWKSRGLLPVGISSKHTYTLASFWEKKNIDCV